MSQPRESEAAQSSSAADISEDWRFCRAPVHQAASDARLSLPLLIDSLDAKCITVLAQLFYRGESGCPKDEERAFHLWYLVATERNYPPAQYW